MFLQVGGFFRENASKYSSNTVLTDATAEFISGTEAIFTELKIAIPDNGGLSANLNLHRKILTDKTLEVSGALTAIAVLANDDILRTKTNFSKTDLRLMKDNDLLVLTQNMYDILVEHAAQLLPFGFDASSISGFDAQVKLFNKTVEDNKSIKQEAINANKELKRLLQSNQELLNNLLDPIMKTTAATEGFLYNVYRQLRKTDDHR